MKPKIGVVDVGGGYRGVYAAGVLDRCMQQGIWFDVGVGVSAGSANLASYCARHPQSAESIRKLPLLGDVFQGAGLPGGAVSLV